MRWKSVVFGALAFAAAHAALRAVWGWADAGRADPAWFLNAGRGVAVTSGCLFLAAALRAGVAARDAPAAVRDGANFGLGAVLAMAVTLVAIGPGTLFPIALAIGAIVVGASSVAGALGGWACRAAARPSR
jgi:hypothetical protein